MGTASKDSSVVKGDRFMKYKKVEKNGGICCCTDSVKRERV